MSKQSIARHDQGYTGPDPKNLPICMNCIHFHMEIGVTSGTWPQAVERNKSCKFGNFAVQKMGTCRMFTRIPKT